MDLNKVLIVDDIEENVDVLVSLLEDDYDISVALNGVAALSLVEEELPDLILLDIMMPEMDGYEVCRRLKANTRTHHIPIIFFDSFKLCSKRNKRTSLGANDYIVKPFNPDIVKSRIRNHIFIKMYQDNLEDLVKIRTNQLERTQDIIITSMGTLAEYRDLETGEHIKRTKAYVECLANYLSRDEKYAHALSKENIEWIVKSAPPLHDIGKIGVPDSILLKPGKLTESEFEEMKKTHLIWERCY